ncbi:unnamed protein product [Rhodiola kirilowii]
MDRLGQGQYAASRRSPDAATRLILHSHASRFRLPHRRHGHVSRPSLAAAETQTEISIGTKIVRTEGVKAQFSGVSATVLRQMLYSTKIAMGLYDLFKHKWSVPDCE